MKKLILALLLLAPSSLYADSITNGSVGLIKISTGVIGTRNWGDKYNENFQIIANTMTTMQTNITSLNTSTGINIPALYATINSTSAALYTAINSSNTAFQISNSTGQSYPLAANSTMTALSGRVGKRGLIYYFVTYCFTTLGFRRLSVEVPEDAEKLLRFYRKLGFRFEGEHRATGLTPTAFLQAGAPGLRPIENAPTWIAKHGSRREGVFWREDRWLDVLRLRLMRSEWEHANAVASDRSRRSTTHRSDRWEDSGTRSVPDHTAVTAGSPAE